MDTSDTSPQPQNPSSSAAPHASTHIVWTRDGGLQVPAAPPSVAPAAAPPAPPAPAKQPAAARPQTNENRQPAPVAPQPAAAAIDRPMRETHTLPPLPAALQPAPVSSLPLTEQKSAPVVPPAVPVQPPLPPAASQPAAAAVPSAAMFSATTVPAGPVAPAAVMPPTSVRPPVQPLTPPADDQAQLERSAQAVVNTLAPSANQAAPRVQEAIQGDEPSFAAYGKATEVIGGRRHDPYEEPSQYRRFFWDESTVSAASGPHNHDMLPPVYRAEPAADPTAEPAAAVPDRSEPIEAEVHPAEPAAAADTPATQSAEPVPADTVTNAEPAVSLPPVALPTEEPAAPVPSPALPPTAAAPTRPSRFSRLKTKLLQGLGRQSAAAAPPQPQPAGQPAPESNEPGTTLPTPPLPFAPPMPPAADKPADDQAGPPAHSPATEPPAELTGETPSASPEALPFPIPQTATAMPAEPSQPAPESPLPQQPSEPAALPEPPKQPPADTAPATAGIPDASDLAKPADAMLSTITDRAQQAIPVPVEDTEATPAVNTVPPPGLISETSAADGAALPSETMAAGTPQAPEPASPQAAPTAPQPPADVPLELPQMRKLAKTVKVGGVTLHEVFVAGRIDEAGLQAVIAVYLKGGDVQKALTAALTQREQLQAASQSIANRTQSKAAAPKHRLSRLAHRSAVVSYRAKRFVAAAGRAISNEAADIYRELRDKPDLRRKVEVGGIVMIWGAIILLLIFH